MSLQEHPHYNKTNFPFFVVTHGNWDIFRNEQGKCAAIPTAEGIAAGCQASHFGDMRYVEKIGLIAPTKKQP